MSDYPPDTPRRRAKLDRRNAARRARYAADPEYREAQREASKAWFASHPHYHRDHKRRKIIERWERWDAMTDRIGGSVHDLGCGYRGKDTATECSCRPVVYLVRP